LIFLLALGAFGYSQALQTGRWRVEMLRKEGHPIVFNFDLAYAKGKPVIHILNASERMEVRTIRVKKDSVYIEMPFFESAFYFRKEKNGRLTGEWRKGGARATTIMPAVAIPNNSVRFEKGAPPVAQLTGKWEMSFFQPNGSPSPAIAQLEQKGDLLTGSILTPTGDYRFLEGIVRGDSMFLSTFDGSHAYVFTGRIKSENEIEGGRFYSGPTFTEQFTAQRNEQAELPLDDVKIYIKPDAPPLDFTYPDIDGNKVSIKDDRFKNKVVVLQIMGSWCPNCMDETAFLSKYYEENKHRGVEIISLAYEYSTDINRSRKTMRKFQERFNVSYPMLITDVAVTDTLRTEKTLPQITPIKVFPSTIFVGKDGTIKKAHGGFFGPATGDAYTKYVEEFEQTINALLEE